MVQTHFQKTTWIPVKEIKVSITNKLQLKYGSRAGVLTFIKQKIPLKENKNFVYPCYPFLGKYTCGLGRRLASAYVHLRATRTACRETPFIEYTIIDILYL